MLTIIIKLFCFYVFCNYAAFPKLLRKSPFGGLKNFLQSYPQLYTFIDANTLNPKAVFVHTGVPTDFLRLVDPTAHGSTYLKPSSSSNSNTGLTTNNESQSRAIDFVGTLSFSQYSASETNSMISHSSPRGTGESSGDISDPAHNISPQSSRSSGDERYPSTNDNQRCNKSTASVTSTLHPEIRTNVNGNTSNILSVPWWQQDKK